MLAKSQRSSNILSHSPKPLADPSLFKRIPAKNLTSPSKLLINNPSVTPLRKNKQINLPIITVNNLDQSGSNISSKSPVKASIFAQFDETKTTRIMGLISPIIQNMSSFMNSNSPETNTRGSRLKTLNICFSPTQGTISPNQKLSQSIDTPLRTPFKDDVPHYQAMTLSGVHHITGKVKKENSRKFIFSKPKDSPLLVNSEPLGSQQTRQSPRLSSDSGSQRSPESPDSQKALLEVLGKPLDYTRKKSTFFTKKSLENHNSNEVSPSRNELGLLKPQPVQIEQTKPKIGPLYILQKKRVSSILTKELEARYGVQLRSPDLSQDEIEVVKSPVKSHKAQYDSPGEKLLLEASTQATILMNSDLKGSTMKSSTEEGPLNFEELSKRFETKEVESSGTSPVGPKLSKRRESKSISGYGPMFQEKDVFGADKGTYFKINKSNKYVKKMNQTMTHFGVKSEPFLDELTENQENSKRETTEPALPQTERAARNQAMMVQVGKMNLNQIVQPEFMERNGTMCVTEFWSHKKKKAYTKIMKEQVKHVTILDEKRKDEFLYKPKRWKEEEFVQAQMRKNAVEGGRHVELAREEAKIRDKLRKHPLPAEKPPVVINMGAKHLRKERSEPYLIKPMAKIPSTQNLRMLTEHVGKESTEEKRELARIKDKKNFDGRLQKTVENFKFKNNKIQKNIEKIFQK